MRVTGSGNPRYLFTINGEQHSAHEWAEKWGVSKYAALGRLWNMYGKHKAEMTRRGIKAA